MEHNVTVDLENVSIVVTVDPMHLCDYCSLSLDSANSNHLYTKRLEKWTKRSYCKVKTISTIYA